MANTVFYAWQSDLPGNDTRSLIERALKKACRAISADPDLATVEPDRDTAGVPGSPDIAATIFEKIATASAVVADVSIVTPPLDQLGNRALGRPSPNPNVLVELGFAKGSLDPSAVLLVMNTDYGGIKDLPFDLVPRRVISFSTAKAESRKKAEKDLAITLESGIRGILEARSIGDDSDLGDEVLVSAVEAQAPQRKAYARRFGEAFSQGLDVNAPRFGGRALFAQRDVGVGDDGFRAQEIWKATKGFAPGLAAFARVAQATALMRDEEVARELLRVVKAVVERYEPPSGWSGPSDERTQAELDVYRLIGYELVLILAAVYLREEAWPLLHELLSIRFRLPQEDETVGIGYASQAADSLAAIVGGGFRDPITEARRRLTRVLHEESQIADEVSRAEIVQADFLLRVHSNDLPEPQWVSQWFPFTLGLLQHGDLGVTELARTKLYASRLAGALNLQDIDKLRERLHRTVDHLLAIDPGRTAHIVLRRLRVSAVGTE